MRLKTLTVLVGLTLVLGDLRFASGDSQCGEGAVRFNDECYLIKQGSCSADSLFIRDKCCRENCVRTCTAENCWHCCEAERSSSPQAAGTSCNQNSCQNCSKCSSSCCSCMICGGSCQNCSSNASCNQCCSQNSNCGSCSNCVSDSSCCQNCCRNTTCNQGGGCQQTNCSNCATKTPCQQTNCSNCGSGTSCTPADCQQTNCANCSGSSSSQGGGQQTCCGYICNNGNCPISPVETTTNAPAMTTNPPPAALECPPGTIPIGRSCRPIYCPKGTIMRNNDCIVLVCPFGTAWNGHKCAVPEPITYNITFYNTVITQSNGTNPGITLKNFNNFTINAPVVVNDDGGSDKNSDLVGVTEGGSTIDEDCTEKTIEPLDRPTATNSTKCCQVMTPRTCEQRNNRWYCYSRRYQRCGDFCTAPVIYLRPPRVYSRPQFVVVPPLSIDCRSRNNCGHSAGGFDCSGCGLGLMESCSHYCYRYSCPSHSCGFYDQQTYCINYPGSYGCLEDDGCFDDDWCS